MIHWHARTQIQAFRESLNEACSIAGALPGGEMLIEEQEEVIAMLERLRAKKRYVGFAGEEKEGRGNEMKNTQRAD
jgi:hypothetical protein